jgi:hypothetical protein
MGEAGPRDPSCLRAWAENRGASSVIRRRPHRRLGPDAVPERPADAPRDHAAPAIQAEPEPQVR